MVTLNVKGSYKRQFDISILVASHLIFLPLWIMLWIIIPTLIWLDDRKSVFYRQKRIGKNGESFNIIKFRTMVVGADELGPAWTTSNDPRITRIGRILRRTALDELPEIINIFKGEMSFVGPRALDLVEQNALERLVPGFERRLKMRPGLTGLAQIYDQTDDPYEKYRYDMEYLEKQSLVLDVRLLLISVKNTLIARWDHRSGKTKLDPTKVIRPSQTGDSPETQDLSVSESDNDQTQD